jgi:hypothetical protein
MQEYFVSVEIFSIEYCEIKREFRFSVGWASLLDADCNRRGKEIGRIFAIMVKY